LLLSVLRLGSCAAALPRVCLRGGAVQLVLRLEPAIREDKMNLVTREELAQLKQTYLAWGEFQKRDEDCAQDYREPDTDPYFRLILTLEHHMAKATFTATGNTCTFDLSGLQAQASALAIDWAKVWADVQKYGPSIVGDALTIATDIMAGNFVKVFTDLAAMGPDVIAAVFAILADFGIVLGPLATKGLAAKGAKP
jgi:hypothetical protein